MFQIIFTNGSISSLATSSRVQLLSTHSTFSTTAPTKVSIILFRLSMFSVSFKSYIFTYLINNYVLLLDS